MFLSKWIKFLVVIVAVITLHGCAGTPSPMPPVSMGIDLNEICNKYHITWQWDGVTQVVLLEYQGNKAKALVGSKLVMVNKERVYLDAPLRRINSSIYVPEDFERKVLVPLGAVLVRGGINLDWSRMRIKSIIIDAGHGGKDPGAQGISGLKEKTVVLDIARHVKDYLQEAGLKVILTRDKDEFVSLADRTEIASKTNADLFISIHANSNPSKKTEGMEVYYCKTSSKRDLDEEQRTKNERTFVKRLNSKHTPMLQEIVADMMYVHKVSQSEDLAKRIVNDSSVDIGSPNRGARPCRFFVVRNTLIPAVLVEVGYLTNRNEERKLSSATYRQKLAVSIARSIIKYVTNY